MASVSYTLRALQAFWRGAGFISLLLVVSSTSSAAVFVEGEDQADIVLSAEGEPMSSALEALSEKFDIEIEGLEYIEKGDPINGQMRGSLKSVLSRLLRNWNHVIVSPTDDPGAVQKLMILSTTFGEGKKPAKAAVAPSVDENGQPLP